MSFWKYWIVRAKFMFGKFQSAMAYLVAQIKSFVHGGFLSENRNKILAFFLSVLALLEKYECLCPEAYRVRFKAILASVSLLVHVLSMSKATEDEIGKAFDSVVQAVDAW